MRVRQLELFVRVCELGSISRAAERLNIAQPALGLQIRQLEHSFGAELITRHSRGVQPTAAGAVVLAMARDIIARVAQTRAEVRAGPSAGVRTVTVGLSPSMTAMLASRILSEGAERLPRVTLHLVEELSHILVEWAEAGRLDVALAYNVPEAIRLRRTALLCEELFLVTAPQSAPVPAGPVALIDVLATKLALPGEADSVRRTVEAGAASLDLPLCISFELQSMTAIKQVVAAGLAATVLPWGTARREIEAGELIARPIIEPVLSRTLYLLQAPNGREPEVAALLSRLASGLLQDGNVTGRFMAIRPPG